MTTIHFAHANGFPAGSYRRLFNALPDNWHVLAIDKLAHNPQYPVSKDWEQLTEELATHIRDHAEEPVIGIGHSFGGVLTYLAAVKYPSLFSGIILLDPPLVTGITRHVVKLIRGTRWFDKVTPAGKASLRCTQWPADTNLVEYFQQKALFRGMQRDCIEDYVNAAVKETDSGFELTYDHQTEAEIFRTVPLNLHQHFKRLQVPAHLITAEHTDVCKPYLINAFIKGNDISHEVMKGVGHMFPMQQPEKLASMLKAIVQQWTPDKPD